tara:strand:+ start:414 stop:617 length:204 start_codon:yes stop_codon:yes gene_type:complete
MEQVQVKYIDTEIEWEGDKLIVEIRVIPNYELESLILSFGEKVKVIEPNFLVQKIEMRVEKLADNYK